MLSSRNPPEKHHGPALADRRPNCSLRALQSLAATGGYLQINPMTFPLPRRRFLKHASAFAILAGTRHLFGRTLSPNDKLNLGVIGVAGRAEGNIEGVQGENIVAVCDVDELYLAKAKERFPQAQAFQDFRKMLELPELDAVVISTADHTHAVATVAALGRGLHVYCEKPLTHSVAEARTVAKAARKAGKATQMGTQIHAGKNYRRVVELVQSGVIGPISEVHVWVTGKSWGGGERPTETPAVPPHLHWDLWLGPAPERPYHPDYVPRNWRRWWDFGGGTLGDMGCHLMDLPFWALGLQTPTAVEAEGPPVHSETAPGSLTVRYDFPARGAQPPVRLTWYHGDEPPAALLAAHGMTEPKGAGVLFIGQAGALFADYGARKLLPLEKFADFHAPPKTIPDSIGHHAEWIAACKTGAPTTCNFDYAGALTEAVLLGNVAYRVGQRIEWDAPNLRITNVPDAARFLRREYRAGWTL
jgi:predicted dehydrogenase